MARSIRTSRIHASCGSCNNEVGASAARCRCGAERPADGWPRVAQLRVFTSPRGRAGDDEVDTLVAPTPLRPPQRAQEPEPEPVVVPPVVAADAISAAPDASPRPRTPRPAAVYARLGGVFLLTFGLTTASALGTWYGFLHPEHDAAPAPDAPPSAVPAHETPDVVADVASEMDAPIDAPIDAMAPAELDAVEPVAEGAPPLEAGEAATPEPLADPAPTRSPVSPPPRAVRVARVAAPAEPAPVAAPEPFAEPAPRVERPSAAVEVPPEIRALTGTYVGRALGRPLSLALDFGPDGALSANLVVDEGGAVWTRAASGTWSIGADGSVTLALVELAADEPRTWTGDATGGVVSGRVLASGRVKGRFHAAR